MTIEELLVKDGIWRTLGKPTDGKQMTFSTYVLTKRRKWHKLRLTTCGPFEIYVDAIQLVRWE